MGHRNSQPAWLKAAWANFSQGMSSREKRSGRSVFLRAIAAQGLGPSDYESAIAKSAFRTPVESEIRKAIIQDSKRQAKPLKKSIDVRRTSEGQPHLESIGPSGPPHHSKFQSYLKSLDKLPEERVIKLIGYILAENPRFNIGDRARAVMLLASIRLLGETRGWIYQAHIGHHDLLGWTRPKAVRKLKPEDVKDYDWDGNGVLSLAGYHVGETKGVDRGERHRCLTRVYVGEFDPLIPDNIQISWGSPASEQRLERIATAIARYRHRHSLKKETSRKAMRQWQADLNFLRTDIYQGRYNFPWPEFR
tara:strand:+ start:9480 stop:10397 length:918 start_codon:yes stop_codon:yes gene_type:complete